jgi:hypothetical protein
MTKMNHNPELVLEWTNRTIPTYIRCLQKKYNVDLFVARDYKYLFSYLPAAEQDWFIFEHDGVPNTYDPPSKRRLIFKDKLVKMKFMLKYSGG